MNALKAKASGARCAAAAAIALLSGCAVGPDYRPPHEPLPSAFGPGSIASATQPASGPSGASVDLEHWWASLDDPELNSLVRRAIDSNFDLRIASARLQEARESETAVLGGVIPFFGGTPGVEGVAGAGRGSGSDSSRGRTSGPLNAATNTRGLQEITHVMGFDAGWELDLFGRFDRTVEAAGADTAAVAEIRNDILISVVADVVRTYIDVRSLQFRLQIAQQNAAAQARTLDLVSFRFRGGLTNELDVALAERQVATTLARVAPFQAAVEAAQRRLAVLLGLFPDALREELNKPTPLPASPPIVAPGMPIHLLRRRPDIRRAERELAGATARIGVATSDLFPRVSLTAAAGLQGQGLGRTPVESSFIYSVGPTAYWPLLDFGRLDAIVKAQNFRTEAALLRYRKTVVTAVQEVDDALSSYVAEQNRLQQLSRAVEASQKAVRLAGERYDKGLADFLNVLDAQRQLFDLQDQYATAQQGLIAQFIALYKALGGGWQGYDLPPPPMARFAIVAAVQEAIDRPKPEAQSAKSEIQNPKE